MLFGADRDILYLEDATEAVKSIDGSRSQGIRQSIEKFLDSPNAAFDKQVEPHLHQARDLGTNTRAFCTWCVDEDSSRELCVVHTIYDKGDEAKFFAEISEFNTEGEELKQQFEELTDEQYAEWIQSMRSNSNFIVVSNE